MYNFDPNSLPDARALSPASGAVPATLDRGIDFRSVMDTVWRCRLFVGKAVVATVLLAVLFVVLVPRTYTSAALLTIDPRGLSGMTPDFMESAGLASGAGSPGPVLLVPGTNTPKRSVRVDGQVIGNERIRVPAGEFDTIKVKRIVYTGDAYFSLQETRVTEFDLYVPALGRPVRTERKSDWMDLSQCVRGGCDFRGNWDVLELIETRAAKR